MSEDRYDVVIVGGGPVGQALGIMLGDRGLRTAVFERWPERYPLPRACGLSDEPARVVQSLGLGDDFRAISDAVIGEERKPMFTNGAGEVLLELSWTQPGPAGWPQMSTFDQPDLEDLFAARLEALPSVDFHRGWEVVAVEQDSSCARVEVRAPEGARTFEAQYVVGADGANSLVREAMGSELLDFGFDAEWMLVDMLMKEQRHWYPYLEQICDPRRPTVKVPSGPGRRRWSFMRLPGESVEQLDTDETVWRLLKPWDLTPDNATLVRHAVYTFDVRWVEDWRSGRMILAGDSAHQMPPYLGQGLGSGLRDAIALAWRLALVISGRAPETVLNSYGPERLAHVRRVSDDSLELAKIICVVDPEQAAERDRRMLAARQDPSLAPPPPPPWRLGAGLHDEDDPLGGSLSIQGRVECDGWSGLLDDLHGPGFLLLGATSDPAEALSEEARQIWAGLGGHSAHVAPGGPVDDVDGTYQEWFSRNEIEVALVRPDFYVFGTGADAQTADALVRRLGTMLS
jgi:2-polyprenyl-6-methoxyphenol hydroxylase-like FAD-dependent oxidoreductase